MDLLYLLHSLLRKKWIIIFCTLIGGVAGFVFNLFREKEYTSLLAVFHWFYHGKKDQDPGRGERRLLSN
ncbi:MAG: hypothetical protein IPP79_00295 [Chitinophagaceae bacterium]|nr:hypothetical protein [Chitinophagaceae bacterium]